ncbi:MAG: SDR family NAD(P)-dependent oxidoreductase [Crocinitomicaceae bacterium]
MIAYITGASSGIGKALAEILLENRHQVVGLSRSQSIKHPNYSHVTIDLSDIKQIKSFSFPANSKDDIILVNNAGMVGPIKPIGQQITEEIVELNNLNSVTPQILSNRFINQYQENLKPNYQIINISSGAGKRPIDAWATYCASKAGLDLFSETISEELLARKRFNWHIFSIAPGVVDTKMQSNIRQSNPKDFLNHQKFIELKNNDELSSPNLVASQLMSIIDNPKMHLRVVFSLRDLT